MQPTARHGESLPTSLV